MNTPPEYSTGATSVITHRISHTQHEQYEAWLNKISPLCKAAQGHLDWHIVRPIIGLTETYTVIIRFDTEENLRLWMHSNTRKQLIEQVQPLLLAGDDFSVSSGLDFLFTTPNATVAAPVRWKQYLATWSVIFPLVLSIPLLVVPILNAIGLPDNRALHTLFITGIIVFLMVYVIMPRYTKLIHAWLFK